MSPIERIRPATQEEIDGTRFLKRKRGEKETTRKEIARLAVSIIKNHPGAFISFVGDSYTVAIEQTSLSQLIRNIARREEGIEVQTVTKKDREREKYYMILRKLPKEESSEKKA